MALPSIMMISLLVLIAGIGIASSGFSENLMGFADADAKRALASAEAGVEDGFNRIVKNKKCNDGGVPSCSSYSLALAEGNVSVSVSGAGASPKTIEAIGTVRGKQKKVRATVTFDSNNKASLGSWTEVAD